MKRRAGYYAAAIAAVIVCNLFLGGFRSSQLAAFLSLAVLAVSLDIVWGYTGILSLGQLLPFGTAAYVTALITTSNPSHSLTALVASVIVGVAISGIVAFAAFRRKLSLVVFGLLTLMLSLTFEEIANQWSDVTGGFNGLTNVPPIAVFGQQLTDSAQNIVVALLAVTVIAAAGLMVSRPLGAVLIGIRENTKRMEALGYNTTRLKITTYACAGGVAGIAGWLNVHQVGFVSPGKYGFVLATNVVLWTLIGGRGTIIGPVLGTLIIKFASATLAESFLQYWVLATGIVFVVAVVVVPGGVLPAVLKAFGRPARTVRKPNLFPFSPRSAPEGTTLLDAAGIHKSYGSFNVLSGLNLKMDEPQLLCFIGPNGAGKSTFLDLLCGQQGHQAGSVTMLGADCTGKPAWEFARKGIGRKFQAPQVLDSLSVAENIAVAAWAVDPRPAKLLTRGWSADVATGAMEVVQRAGLAERRDDLAGDLSHGEKQWLEIAMAMASGCQILLLDEPTAGMTVAESLDAASLLRELHAAYSLPIVIVEHDMAFIRAVADRVTVLSNGNVLADGSVTDVENNPDVKSVYLGANQ